jgi:uncharacterized membrane protein YqjE
MGNGVKPPETADKSLGEIVNDISTKSSLLVREEVELAKAEVQSKVKKLGAGAAAIAVAGFFLLMMLIMLLHAAAWGIAELLGNRYGWVGFLIVAGALLLLAIVGALLALRLFKRGTPPVPQQAIEEAKETRRAIEEARR